METMLEPTAITQKFPDLREMVHCQECGKTMTSDAGNFVCNPQSSMECPTRPVDADWLLRSVVSRVVGRMATDETMDRIAAQITEVSDSSGRMQAIKLRTVECDIASLNGAKLSILKEVEQETRNYQDASDEINEINKTVAGLAYEALVAREELDKLDFLSDQEGITQTARDIGTYLESPDPELVQELLELLVKEVQVGDGEAVITYRSAVPTEDNPEGTMTDRIPLA